MKVISTIWLRICRLTLRSDEVRDMALDNG